MIDLASSKCNVIFSGSIPSGTASSIRFIDCAMSDHVPARIASARAMLTTGSSQYQRVVFDGYGHQDVFNGALASRDTYPAVLKHLKDVNA